MAETMRHPYYPIIYVRGYAATMTAIENTAATPYMGFNLGSTKIRKNYDGRPTRHIFESPLLRLMKDEGYQDTFANGDELAEGVRAPARSIWIFRYYEPVSEDLGDGVKRTIPQFAEELRAFILKIREHVCGTDTQARAKFRVYLVAHSMGGLICRCYLQNVCKHGVGSTARNKTLELPGPHLVDKVFTYATPHNGIDMKGINVPDLTVLEGLHTRNFNRDYMWQYLRLGAKGSKRPGKKDVNGLNGAFPEDRFFCMVGTNHRDYHEFANLSRRVTGEGSDGLVMMKNAWVDGAPRAYAHRAHSGHFGIVNSEEGYQNLRRFLFGHVAATVEFQVDHVALPKEIKDKLAKEAKKGRLTTALYRIDTGACVRGAPYFLHERRAIHHSEIERKEKNLQSSAKANRIYLFSGYLHEACKTAESKAIDPGLSFAVDVSVSMPEIEVEKKYWPDASYQVQALLRETVILNVTLSGPGKPVQVTYRFGNENASSSVTPATEKKLPNGSREIQIPIGYYNEADYPDAYIKGTLIITSRPWNA